VYVGTNKGRYPPLHNKANFTSQIVLSSWRLTVFTNVRDLDPILSKMNLVYAFNHFFLRSVLILFSCPRLGLPCRLLPWGSLIKMLHAFLISPISVACPVRSIFLHLMPLTMSGDEANYEHTYTFFRYFLTSNCLRSKYQSQEFLLKYPSIYVTA